MKDDTEHFDETLVEKAKELLECSDSNMMNQSLANNSEWEDNLQMAVNLNLKTEIKNLNYNLKKFDKASKFTS